MSGEPGNEKDELEENDGFSCAQGAALGSPGSQQRIPLHGHQGCLSVEVGFQDDDSFPPSFAGYHERLLSAVTNLTASAIYGKRPTTKQAQARLSGG